MYQTTPLPSSRSLFPVQLVWINTSNSAKTPVNCSPRNDSFATALGSTAFYETDYSWTGKHNYWQSTCTNIRVTLAWTQNKEGECCVFFNAVSCHCRMGWKIKMVFGVIYDRISTYVSKSAEFVTNLRWAARKRRRKRASQTLCQYVLIYQHVLNLQPCSSGRTKTLPALIRTSPACSRDPSGHPQS